MFTGNSTGPTETHICRWVYVKMICAFIFSYRMYTEIFMFLQGNSWMTGEHWRIIISNVNLLYIWFWGQFFDMFSVINFYQFKHNKNRHMMYFLQVARWIVNHELDRIAKVFSVRFNECFLKLQFVVVFPPNSSNWQLTRAAFNQ